MSFDAANSAGAAGPKKTFFKRKKSCPFSGPGAMAIDWKDVKMLGKFLSERGKMTPSRITNVSMKKQRELAKAIKRARFMALLPYVRGEADRSERPERFERPERTERFDRSDRA